MQIIIVYFFLDQIHNLQSYVRDFYFFKRSQYPQLLMVHMEPEAAYDALQRQAFTLKLLEIGKVLMSWSILKRPDQVLTLHIMSFTSMLGI